MPNDPGKPDFSNVQGGSSTSAPAKPDFSNVQAGSSTTAPAKETVRTYTVVSGDSLSRIAKKFYGNANHWHTIFEANRNQIDNPDLIHPGQVLKIPFKTDGNE